MRPILIAGAALALLSSAYMAGAQEAASPRDTSSITVENRSPATLDEQTTESVATPADGTMVADPSGQGASNFEEERRSKCQGSSAQATSPSDTDCQVFESTNDIE